MWKASGGTTSFEFSLKLDEADNMLPRSANDPSGETDAQGNANNPGIFRLPSSFWSGKEGCGVRYILSVTQRLKSKPSSNPTCISSHQEIFVLEHQITSSERPPTFAYSPTLIAEAEKVVGGWLKSSRGEVKLSAECFAQESNALQINDTAVRGDGAWVAGSTGFVGLEITNDSKRKVRLLDSA
jgi:hypothetical protein